MLLVVDFLDELAGVAFVGLPDLQGEFAISWTAAVFAAFTVPGVLAWLVEPALLLLADRYPRRRRTFVVTGLLLMGTGLVAAGCAPGPVSFAVASALAWVGNGLGVNLAQATLMDAEPDRREHWMARWTLAGTVGDLAAPLFLAALAAGSLDWRAASVGIGALTCAHAWVLSRQTFPAPSGEDPEEEVGVGEALREALQNRRLMIWMLGVATCGLLDEVFVAFGSAWLGRVHGATLAERGISLGIGTLGGILGLLWLDRALAAGADPVRRLRAVSAASLVGFAAWLAAPNLLVSTAALFVLELTTAQLYPLAMAQAHRALPGRSARVEAVAAFLAPFDLLAPVALGWVADRVGLPAALALLGLQPLLLGLVAARHRPGSEPGTA